MQFLELKQKLSQYSVFSLNDIKKLDSSFYRTRLNEWQNKGYIKKIRRGYYIFSDQPLNEPLLFSIANKIYSPSYISLEMALSHYGLIPESVYGITSVTTGKTERFKTEVGVFIYRKLKPELMFGYKIIELPGVSFKMAEIEKALLDFFYLNARLKDEADFFELRINAEEFNIRIDMKKMLKYLEAFNNKSLAKRVKNFLKFINKNSSDPRLWGGLDAKNIC